MNNLRLSSNSGEVEHSRKGEGMKDGNIAAIEQGRTFFSDGEGSVNLELNSHSRSS